jgi:hypothetical protein
MADKLAIFRGALRLLGNAHGLSSLTEVSAAREALDNAWEPCIDYLLEQGLWNFALRPVEIDNNTAVTALYGYDYTFSKPADYVRTAAISDEGTFLGEFEDFQDAGDYWYANVDPLFVSYVSDDVAYGFNVTAWRQSFAKTVEAYLAFECGLPIAADRGNRNDLYTLYEKRLSKAKSLDAIDERVRFKPTGRLVRSRYSTRRDR